MTDRRNDRHGFATRAIHAGYDPADAQGALSPPVYMTSTFTFETAEEGAALFRGEKEGYVYGRTKNPTQSILEERLADLEGAQAGLVFASGMGAISATLWTLLKAGDRVVIDWTLYGNSFSLFTKGLTKFGVEVVPADFTRTQAVADALSNGAALVYFETPANPNLRVIDIAAISGLAREAGALTIVDNTFATPVLQRPLDLGADLVVHSATKYLSGHGDLLAGAVLGPRRLVGPIRSHGLRYLTGATLSPLAAFLVMRGLKTLELRMDRHVATATAIATQLQGHPSVERLMYPALDSHPQIDVARRQMSAGGGLVSFELRGGKEAGLRFMDRLQLVRRAVSLGDAETLVQHPASMTHAQYTPEQRAAHGISEGLVRLSVGLETTRDIVADILEALEGV